MSSLWPSNPLARAQPRCTTLKLLICHLTPSTSPFSAPQCLYWIHALDPSLYPIPSEEPFSLMPGVGPPPPDPSFQPLGHIALDREDYLDPPNKLLASRETGIMTLATFFILKSQQGRGLGNRAMDLVEEEAKALGAPEITLNT